MEDWIGRVNYIRNIPLEDYDVAEPDIEIDVETLLIVGNADKHVPLDLISQSSKIPKK